jgi:hypothetical protein
MTGGLKHLEEIFPNLESAGYDPKSDPMRSPALIRRMALWRVS